MNTDEIDNYLALSSIDHSAWSYATSPHSVLTSISRSIISGADLMNLNNPIENSAYLVPSTISYKDYLSLSEKATNLYQPTMYNEWYKSSGLALASTYSPSSVLSGLTRFGISLDHVGILNRPVSVSEYSVPIPSTFSYKDYLGLGEKATNLYQPTTYNEWYKSPVSPLASNFTPCSVLSGLPLIGNTLDHIGALNRSLSAAECSVPSTFSYKNYSGLYDRQTSLYQLDTHNEWFKNPVSPLVSTQNPSSIFSYSDFMERSIIEIERSTNYYQVNHKNCSTDLSSIQKLLSLADDNDIKKKVNCSIRENAGNISVFIQINFYGDISGDRNHFGDKIIYQ